MQNWAKYSTTSGIVTLPKMGLLQADLRFAMPESTFVVLLVQVDAPHVARFINHCHLLQIVTCTA